MYNGTMKRGKIMTRDKAIEEVKNYENYPNGLSKECRDYIVKALEQVPSSLENPNLSENPISSTTKNCESCRHYGLHHEICNYCYKCSLWTEKEPTTKKCITCAYREIDGKPHEMCKSCVCGDRYRQEPTTKNDLVVDYTINGLDDFIEFGKRAFGVELTIKKSDNPDTYEKLFGTTKNDLAVEKIIDEIEKEFEKVDIPSTDKLIILAKVQNALYKCAVSNNSLGMIRPKGHWIEERNDYGEIEHWHCSNCYDDSGFITTCKWDYCPSCGSNNREVEK